MKTAKRGELAVVAIKRSSTALHGPTTETKVFQPIAVVKIDRRGFVTEGKDTWGCKVKIGSWFHMQVYTVSGTVATDLLPKLEREYDSFDEIKAAVRNAMSPVPA